MRICCLFRPEANYRLSRRNTTAFRPWIRAVTLGNVPPFKRLPRVSNDFSSGSVLSVVHEFLYAPLYDRIDDERAAAATVETVATVRGDTVHVLRYLSVGDAVTVREDRWILEEPSFVDDDDRVIVELSQFLQQCCRTGALPSPCRGDAQLATQFKDEIVGTRVRHRVDVAPLKRRYWSLELLDDVLRQRGFASAGGPEEADRIGPKATDDRFERSAKCIESTVAPLKHFGDVFGVERAFVFEDWRHDLRASRELARCTLGVDTPAESWWSATGEVGAYWPLQPNRAILIAILHRSSITRSPGRSDSHRRDGPARSRTRGR